MSPAGLAVPEQSHIHEIAASGATSLAAKSKVAQRCPARRSAGQRLNQMAWLRM